MTETNLNAFHIGSWTAGRRSPKDLQRVYANRFSQNNVTRSMFQFQLISISIVTNLTLFLHVPSCFSWIERSKVLEILLLAQREWSTWLNFAQFWNNFARDSSKLLKNCSRVFNFPIYFLKS